MANEMIERAAEAIYRSQEWDFASDEDFSDLTDGCKHVFRIAARAAIEAMREPTKSMLVATDVAFDEDIPLPEQAWEMMIDDILIQSNT